MASTMMGRIVEAISKGEGISFTYDELIELRNIVDQQSKHLAQIVLRDVYGEVKELYDEAIFRHKTEIEPGLVASMLAERAELVLKTSSPFIEFKYFNKNPVPLRKA